MASIVLLAPLAAGSALGRPAAAGTARTTLLGSRRFAPNGAGFGAAHPSRIFNGGDPSGLVTHIHWVDWGHSVATATGKNAIFKPHGGFYSTLATVELRATNLGLCHAGEPLAYRRLSIRAPSHPGGKLGPWRLWNGAASICFAR